MNWIDRLNQNVTGRVTLPLSPQSSTVEVLYWAHSAALRDNVPHRHAFFEVCLVGGHGRGIFHAQGQDHPIVPGDLFIARPGVLHQIRNTGDREMELFWVSFATEPGRNGTVSSLSPFAASSRLVMPDSAHGLLSLWSAGLQSAAENDAVPPATISVLAGALLAGIVHAGANLPESPLLPVQERATEPRVRLAVRYIHDNLDRALSVAEVAAQVHVSPRHLSRLLEDFVGVPPAAYIERARIDRAAILLTRSNLPIKAIAEQVGYGSVHHFSRAFTRVQGMPPGAFRHSGMGPIRRDASTEPLGALV